MKNREKKLVKNTIIISIGKICTSMVTFLLLPLYTNILTPADYGIVDLLNTLIMLLFPIITFQLEKGAFRELIECREDEKKKKIIISSTFYLTIIQCLIFGIIFYIGGNFFNSQYKIFLATNVIAYIFLSLLQQFARGLDKLPVFSFSSFLSAFSIIVFNIVFLVVLKMGVTGMLLGTLLGYIIATIYVFFALKLFKYLSIKQCSKKVLKALLKYSIPLIPNTLAWWVFSASDRVIVSTILGVDQNGILSASLKFSAIVTTIYNIFDTSWIESITVCINDNDISEYFSKMFNSVLKVFISFSMLLIVSMPIVFPIMINKEYSDGYKLIPITLISAVFNVAQGLIAVIYAAKKNTKSIALTSIVSAIVNIVVHLVLIKFIGLYAAVISTLIAYILISVNRINDVNKKYFKINLDKKIILCIPIICIILILYNINNIYTNIANIVMTSIFVILFNKNSIKIIYKIFKKKIKREDL